MSDICHFPAAVSTAARGSVTGTASAAARGDVHTGVCRAPQSSVRYIAGPSISSRTSPHTTLSAARAAIEAMAHMRDESWMEPHAIQDYLIS